MKYKGAEINGTLATGAELVRLMSTKNGVLVYHLNTLYFIGFQNDRLKIAKLRTIYPALETKIFVSDEFDKVQKLDKSKLYLLLFGNVTLQIIDYKTGEVVLVLTGYDI